VVKTVLTRSEDVAKGGVNFTTQRREKVLEDAVLASMVDKDNIEFLRYNIEAEPPGACVATYVDVMRH